MSIIREANTKWIFLSAICCVLDADPLEGGREELAVDCAVVDVDGNFVLL